METKQNIGAIITLIVGVGVATLVLIFVSVLAGSTYNQVEPKLDAVGTETVGPYPLTWSFRALYNNQDNKTTFYAMPDTYNVGSISFWHNTTELDPAHFGQHVNGTVQVLDTTYNGTDVNVLYTYDNATMRTYVKQGVIGAFQGLSQTGDYLPIIVLAVVITLVLGMILGMVGFKKPGGGSGAL